MKCESLGRVWRCKYPFGKSINPPQTDPVWGFYFPIPGSEHGVYLKIFETQRFFQILKNLKIQFFSFFFFSSCGFKFELLGIGLCLSPGIKTGGKKRGG